MASTSGSTMEQEPVTRVPDLDQQVAAHDGVHPVPADPGLRFGECRRSGGHSRAPRIRTASARNISSRVSCPASATTVAGAPSAST